LAGFQVGEAIALPGASESVIWVGKRDADVPRGALGD
jgi:hypothetical protein